MSTANTTKGLLVLFMALILVMPSIADLGQQLPRAPAPAPLHKHRKHHHPSSLKAPGGVDAAAPGVTQPPITGPPKTTPPSPVSFPFPPITQFPFPPMRDLPIPQFPLPPITQFPFPPIMPHWMRQFPFPPTQVPPHSKVASELATPDEIIKRTAFESAPRNEKVIDDESQN